MSNDSRYQFVTRWQIPAAREQVWQELMTPDQWPIWWRGVVQVELLEPARDELGTGALRRYTWRSRLPYSLTFNMRTVRIEPFEWIEGTATGELQGSGVWHLTQVDGVTHVRYDWNVEATKWWMRWFSPVARRLFEWNHDVVMEWGRQGLLRRLNCSGKRA